ncbi:MAG: alpha/beta hydrolase domain-containing protein, partial [Bryobacteraceae bacterium]
MLEHLCCLAPIGAIAGLLAACGPTCQARVTSIVIDSTRSVTGASIPYETIRGRAFGELDPKDPHNSIIQDIGLAPKDAAAKVRYIATFQITTPANPAQRNGLLIYEVSNRGHNAIPAASSLVSGATYLQSGWQGDLLANCIKPYPCTSLAKPYSGTPAQVIQVPVAHRPDGSPITGPVYGRIANAKGSTAQMIIFTTPVPYKPLSMDTTKSRLWSVASQTATGVDGPKTPIAPSDWAWADCRTVPFPGTPDPTRIWLKHGFN